MESYDTIFEQPPLRLRIEPSRGWVPLRLHDLWQHRELIYFLVWRDIKVRYKQTLLGAGWAILQPFITMVVFSIFFGNLARIPSNNVPYPIFSYAALVPWTFFANGLSSASNSLVGNSHLIKKVYFPRLILPLAAVAAGVIDFVLAFAILILMMLAYGITPTVYLLLLPAFFMLALMAALGLGLWLSALNAQFRDVHHLVPFLLQFWLFITPIAYPSSLIENEMLRTAYGLNPMAGVVEGFRWVLLDTPAPGGMIFISVTATIALLISGLAYFRKMEKSFADVI